MRFPFTAAALVLLVSVFLTGCAGRPADNSARDAASPEPARADTAPAPAAASGLPERVVKAGKITFGSDTTYAPMEFMDKDGRTPIGFDVDLAKALAAKLGVQAEIISVEWNGIMTGLLAKRYDAIISSMNITPDRLKEVDFIEYARMPQVFVTRKDTPPIRTEADLAGRVIAVQADTTSMEWVEKLPKEKQPREVKKFVDNTAVYLEVQNKRAEGVVTDEAVGRYYAMQSPDIFAVTGVAIAPEPVGIAVNKDDPELKAALQQALDALRREGKYAEIARKWFGGELGR